MFTEPFLLLTATECPETQETFAILALWKRATSGSARGAI